MAGMLDVFVPGVPAPFATAGERSWRDAIASQLVGTAPSLRATEIALDFTIRGSAGYPDGPDLDNLCEPIFSVVVNRLGWFGGRRSAIQAFRATKRVGEPTGCRIRVIERRDDIPTVGRRVLLSRTWPGALPRNARDPAVATWVRASMLGAAGPGTRLGVRLSFEAPTNLGDIATGRVKNVIDCLYPILGGSSGAPQDSRIVSIEARNGSGTRGAVQVDVFELAPSAAPP